MTRHRHVGNQDWPPAPRLLWRHTRYEAVKLCVGITVNADGPHGRHDDSVMMPWGKSGRHPGERSQASAAVGLCRGNAVIGFLDKPSSTVLAEVVFLVSANDVE